MGDKRSAKRANPMVDEAQAARERETIRKALSETEGPTPAEIEQQKQHAESGDPPRHERRMSPDTKD